MSLSMLTPTFVLKLPAIVDATESRTFGFGIAEPADGRDVGGIAVAPKFGDAVVASGSESAEQVSASSGVSASVM